MRYLDIIIKKRDGLALTREEIEAVVNGYTRHDLPDYQMASFLMAVFFRGMDARETSFLTMAMLDSGERIELGGIGKPLIDKHSTGGVGDKISLVLAPLAAACGIGVPMMSGRGLGHTGGTLDKLEAIPGYGTRMTNERFVEALTTVGFAMIGQSERIAPADKLMYALRDATATVESIPLITASILSKKCAEGADGFVFDVKCGKGAFMKNLEDARSLAQSLVLTSREMGKKAVAIITDMNEPLGNAVGNSIEVEEAAACLKGKGPSDIMEVTLRLTSRMLILAGVCKTAEEGESLCSAKIADGSALKKFLDDVAFQGGDTEYITGKKRFEKAPCDRSVLSPEDGFVSGIDAYGIGHAAVLSGAGRAKKEDGVLPYSGILLCRKTGDAVRAGEEIARVYGDDSMKLEDACTCVKDAYQFDTKPPRLRGSRIIEEMVE
jgi:pyrimidine-nucleoside phosphorylase